MIRKNVTGDDFKNIEQIFDKNDDELAKNFYKLIQSSECFDKHCNLTEPNLLDDYEIEINYMTHSQVKRKRFELYKKKLMF